MHTAKLPFLVLLLFPLFVTAQNNTAIDAIAGKLVSQMHNNSREQLLISTDKNIYEDGEAIRFSVFITDSLNGRFVRRTRNLFVDLVNDNDSVVQKLLLHGDELQVNGALLLKDSTLHGLYWVRAYTRKIVDENINNVAVYPVYVLNKNFANDAGPVIPHKQNNTATGGKPVIEIFPEGGNLMSGTKSVVALFIHDVNGTAIAANGEIHDNKNKTVATFTSNIMGRAKFEFEPTWYGRYTVFLQTAAGLDSVAVLPAVNMHGAQVAVINATNDNLHLRVMMEDSLYSPDYASYLLCMHKDSLCFASIGKGMYELNVPVTDFPAGQTDILLYNSNQELISKRSVFIDKPKASVAVSTDKQNYAARENVKMDVAVTASTGKPVVAALAISVKDSRIADTANYYFKDNMPMLSAADMDLVMLTQQNDASNFSVTSGAITTTAKDYLSDSMIVSGHVFNRKHEAVQNRQVTLFSKQLSSVVYQDTTDASGSFSFVLPDFADSTEFYLQVANMRGVKEEFNINLDNYHFPEFKTPASLKEKYYASLVKEPAAVKKYINNVIIGSGKGWLQPVTVTGNKSADGNKNKIYDGYIIKKSDIKSGANGVLNAVLASGKFHLLMGFLVTGGPSKFGLTSSDEPLVVMDGVQINTNSGVSVDQNSPVIAFLQGLQSEEIDHIRLKNESESSEYGLRGARGVIEIYSSRSISTGNISTTGLAVIHPQGYNTALPLPAPDYTDKKNKNVKTVDDRTSLYWNGGLVTDNTGNATINFFTSDNATTYLVTVTGITGNGEKVFKTYTITRK